MEPALSNLLRPRLVAWNIPEAAVAPIATVVAMFVATVLSMILGELVPKNFALALPLATAKLVVPFQIAFTTVFKPAVVVLNGSANGVLRSMGIEPRRSSPAPAARRSCRRSCDGRRAPEFWRPTPPRCWTARSPSPGSRRRTS